MTKVKNILKRYTTILLCCFFLQLSSQNPFIENKGQFPKQVIAKVSIPSDPSLLKKTNLSMFFIQEKN